MYGTINTGVPASTALVITLTGSWSLGMGVLLVMGGVLGVLLAWRSRKQRDRVFSS